MLRYITLLLVFILTLSTDTESLEVQINEDTHSIRVRNQFYETSITYHPNVKITQFSSNGKDYLWPNSEKVEYGDSLTGHQVMFYKDHPLSATSTYTMPSSYTAAREVLDATTIQVTIQSNDFSQLSIAKEFVFNSSQSMFQLKTTVQNSSNQPVNFYPTEITKWNCELKNSGFPNMNTYLDIPIQANKQPSFDIMQGGTNNNQIKFLDIPKVLQSQYRSSLNEAVMTSSSNWMAFVMGMDPNPQALAIENRFLKNDPKPVDQDVYLLINGAGELKKNGKIIKQDIFTEKFILTKRVLGKAQLQPKEELIYEQIWSTSSCPKPVKEVRDGIIYNQPVQFFRYQQGFLVYGVIGIPQEGAIQVRFYDKEGNILDKGSISLLMGIDPTMRRPGNAVITHPTVLSHRVDPFKMYEEDEDGNMVPITEKMLDKTNSVRLYLTDLKGNKLLLLAEAYAPFPVYKERNSKQ